MNSLRQIYRLLSFKNISLIALGFFSGAFVVNWRSVRTSFFCIETSDIIELVGAVIQVCGAIVAALWFTHWANQKTNNELKRKEILADQIDKFAAQMVSIHDSAEDYLAAPCESERADLDRKILRANNQLALIMDIGAGDPEKPQEKRIREVYSKFRLFKGAIMDSTAWEKLEPTDSEWTRRYTATYSILAKSLYECKFSIFS